MSSITLLLSRFQLVLSLLRLTPFDTSIPENRALERYRRVILTGIASVGARGINLLTTLISVPLTLSYLGTERYGVWMTISSFSLLLSFADLGIGNGLLNAISDAYGKDDRQSARVYISSAFLMLTSVAVFLGICFGVAYSFVPWFRIFNVKSSLAIAETGPVVIVFIISFLLNLPFTVVQRVQLGYQQGYANNIWQILGSVFGLGAVLFAIYIRAGLPMLVFAFIGIPTLLSGIQSIYVFGLQANWLAPSFSYVTISGVKYVFRTGLLFFVLQVAVAVAYASDNLVLAQVMNPSAVAEYSVVSKLFSIPTLFLNLIFLPLWPAYGEAITRGDIIWVKRTLARSLLLVLLIAGIPSVLFVLFGKLIIFYWVGPAILPSISLLLGTGIWTILSSGGNAVAMFLNGANVIKFQVVFATLMAASALYAKIVLTNHIGIAGIPWGTVVAYTTFSVLPSLIYVPRIIAKLDTNYNSTNF